MIWSTRAALYYTPYNRYKQTSDIKGRLALLGKSKRNKLLLAAYFRVCIT